MVQFIPARDDWANAFRNIGQGASEGYMNRTDEKSIQKAIEGLGPNPSPRDLLNALTNTKTYNNSSKQKALQNYIGVAEFEELQKKEKQKIKDEEEKLNRIKNSGIALVNNSQLSDDEKKNLIDQINNNQIELSAIESITKPNKIDKTAIEQDEKKKTLNSAIKRVDEMIGLRKKGNLGTGSNITKYFSNDIAKDFGSYEQLGKSLIQLSTTIPIRNRQEFETLAEKLYDPTILDAEALGMLEKLRGILEDSLGEEPVATEPKRKPLSAFRK